MGNKSSKAGGKNEHGKGVKANGYSGSHGKVGGGKYNMDEDTDVELELLRRAIKWNPEGFILNNLMMCVQFFGNYEEEIEHIKESLVSSREAELNKKLPAQKHVLLPDVLQEHIAKHLGFTSTRQTIRPTIEPLQPVRIYTVHDNIDITEQNFSSHYSSLSDSVLYSMLLKPTEHQGYVQLRLLEESVLKSSIREEDEVDLSSIAEDDDELYTDSDSVYGPRPNSAILSGQSKKTNRTAKYNHARSMPDLYRDDIYGSRGRIPSNLYEGRSSQSVKGDSDYERISSADERGHRSKRIPVDGRRGPQMKSKSQKGVSYSRTSSTSSGYRSANYAMDSDSSYAQTSTHSNGYGSAPMDEKSSGRKYGSNKSVHNEEKDEYLQYMTGNVELPRRCFKRVTYTSDGRIYDPREEKKQLLNSKQRRIKLAQRRHNFDIYYMSSTEFMRVFITQFVHRLAEPLGFDREAVEDVKREGCVIYCDKVMVFSDVQYSQIEQYEIIPAVWVQWPECAMEWLDRPRSTWPDYTDVDRIKDFGCHVVPEGFVPKKESNLMQDLEWQLTFPAAERYLETCMTQAQVQVYLIALMLHKTFMRPVFDTMFGLTTAHIRNKLFWMIEEKDRPSMWPDNRTGECLLTLLNSLYHCISQSEPKLSDYFARERNLFQRIPCEHLLHTQKQLKRIIENPVMYVFHAMENIRHSEKFFPRLDYEKLLKILTLDSMALINPALEPYIMRPMAANSDAHSAREEKYSRGGFWDTVKTQKDQQKTYYSRPVTNKTLINARKATDSIIEISIRCAELEGPRLCALLDFFIRHFIKIAERCHQYRAYRQRIVYLDQADRLSILLSEHPRYKDDARAYRDKIKLVRRKGLVTRLPNDPPETPKRNLEAPIFSAPLKEHIRKESREAAPQVLEPREETKKVKIVEERNVLMERRKLQERKKSEDRKLSEERKNSEEHPKQQIVEVVVHQVHSIEDIEEEEEVAKSKTVPVDNESKLNIKDEQVPEKEQKPIVSLAKNSQESFLSETTHI